MDLTPALMLKAYASGIFPMADSADSPELFWFEPEMRGILPLDGGFHVPTKLRQFIRRSLYEIKVDTSFAEVIRHCASAREDTWINQTIIDVFTELHHLGHAHSVEAWQDGQLIGGLYGVRIGAAFFGESMFSLKPNASKCCLVHLVEKLQRGGFQLCDVQYQNDHLKQFGIIEIPQAEYRERLKKAKVKHAIWG